MSFDKRSIILLAALVLCIIMAFVGMTPKAPAEEPVAAEPAAEPAPAADPNAPAGVAASLGDYTVLVADVADDYYYFITYMSYYGVEAPTDPAEIAEYVEMIVDTKIADLAYAWAADGLGLTLTPELEAQVDAGVNEQRDGLIESYKELAAEELGEGATPEQIEQRGMELLDIDVHDYMGCDFDTYLLAYRQSLVIEAKGMLLEDYIKANVTVTDEETAAWYDAAVEADKSAAEADPFAFRDKQENFEAHLSDLPAFYAPAGFVRVQIIEIAMDPDSSAAFEANKKRMSELEAEYGALALNGGTGKRGAEIRAEHAELVAANEGLLADTKARAETIHEEVLTSNMAFGAICKKYNETLSEEAAENGTLVYVAGEDPRYSAEFTAVVANLGDGDVSDILEIGGNYYIVRRVGAIPEGPVAFETVKEAAAQQALLVKQDNVWNEAADKYISDAAAAAVKYPSNYASVGLGQ